VRASFSLRTVLMLDIGISWIGGVGLNANR
jgi:hypothetical protein